MGYSHAKRSIISASLLASLIYLKVKTNNIPGFTMQMIKNSIQNIIRNVGTNSVIQQRKATVFKTYELESYTE